MSINWPQNGEYNISSYQMSALPYVTSSVISTGEIHRHEFPYVTRFIDVVNRGGSASDKIALGFTENGMTKTNNFVILNQGASVNEEIRTTTLFISCSRGTSIDYQIFCGLTNIPSKNFLILSSSNGHFGVG
jgi:hypothetical protein